METIVKTTPPHKFRNASRLVSSSDPSWTTAQSHGLIDISATATPDGKLVSSTGHEFLNLCSCSYLGLHRHPKILKAMKDVLEDGSQVHFSLSTVRIRPKVMDEAEELLGEIFGGHAILGLSASVLSASLLPLIAAGQLTDGEPTTMVFDKRAHFSMAYIKPICADESEVLTIEHNDLNALEDICKVHPRVAYVADGAYSTGGTTLMDGLLSLQEKYGLFLYFDDAHSISVTGKNGEGFVRSQLKELNPRTLIMASLNKGFGTGGGVAILNSNRFDSVIRRHGGPLGWSQSASIVTMAATKASAELHLSDELGRLQKKLQQNIALFDSIVSTPQDGAKLPVRLIPAGSDEQAIQMAEQLLARGFYAAPVYFPIVPRGHAGVRILLRSDIEEKDMLRFAQAVAEVAESNAAKSEVAQ
ncbi:MAG: aminotransferase class I/II-fold pyridoxal phosphate-dependent enzyme [Bdellovibrionaceae bacterium]|nr:aminotransferase class I/II-fold pyridoxal phosphate-dependent enzyme [Pseudobdellovibrionaceae bacterium]